MGQIVGHQFDSSCLVVKFFRGNALKIRVKEIKDGQGKWRDFYGDGIAKGGKLFGVYSFN